VVADLAGAILDSQVQATADHEAAADARAADDAQGVLRSSGRADACLGERKRVSVVDQTNRPPEGFLDRRRNRAADPIAVQVGKQNASPLAVEEPGQRDPDRLDRLGRARERGQPLQNSCGAILGSRRLRAAFDDPLAVEHDELDVRATEVEPERPHRVVQPPSTVSTEPVTKVAVAR
jgi:hypothetical protein